MISAALSLGAMAGVIGRRVVVVVNRMVDDGSGSGGCLYTRRPLAIGGAVVATIVVMVALMVSVRADRPHWGGGWRRSFFVMANL